MLIVTAFVLFLLLAAVLDRFVFHVVFKAPEEPSSSSSSSSSSISSSSSSSKPELTEAEMLPGSGNLENSPYVDATMFEKIKEYSDKNSDVKGWLTVEGTNIDYPVVHYKNNSTYLSLGYDKNYSFNGVIWADYEDILGNASQMSRNMVIYGHNWTNYSADPRIGNENDVMFAQLTAFQHLDFAKENLFIHFTTEEQSMTYKIFASFYTEDTFPYYYPNQSDEEFMAVVESARERSEHDYDVLVDKDDKIITLSTCTRRFGRTDRQRFVVMARLLRQEEKAVPYAVTANPDPVRPNL
ncbi:class B sortase [Zongyangia hominis]|uniref:Class B sortase n=1 Tax=Zongyangia hominis TaxID=2763677 RepID=A0A926EF14_9FIRM|nr:class B sortase [Zongyangia hominis]MBC8570671.1 class B sortase [Zongyangia hominis]